MVNIGPETVLLLGNLAKVSFGRFATAGLKLASQFLVAARNVFDVPATEKLVVRGDGEIIDTPVDADDFTGKRNVTDFFFKNDVQKYAVPSQEQIGRSTSPVEILFEVLRNSYRKSLSAVNGQERNFAPIKPDVIASGIVPNRAELALWTGHFLLFPESIFGSFKCFSGFRSSGNGKLRREVKPCSLIRLMVQRNAVRVFVLPTCLANVIKSTSVRLKRWLDLFGRDI